MYIKQKGLTLVEMMIAFTLSSILMLGLFQIFNSNKQAFGMQGGMARVQEGGRIGMEFLSRDFRNAAFMGCSTGGLSSNFINNVNPAKYADGAVKQAITIFDGDQAILGFDNVTAIASGSTLDGFGLAIGTSAGNVISGTDIIVLQGAKPCSGGKVVSGGTGTANIKIADAAACGLTQESIVIVSNCTTSEAFGITNNPLSSGASDKDTLSHAANLNVNVKLTGTYDDDSYIYKPSSTLFYIGNGASGEPSLFMKTLENETAATGAYGTHELAEGIEDMQFLYGEDTDDDGAVNRYVAAGTASLDMNRVIAIRTRLLTRTQDNLTQTNQTYNFNGVSITATDSRMRVPFETTNAIRNRIK